MAAALDPIEPSTDGTVTVTLSVLGVLKDDATLTANVFSPKGVQLATAVAMTPTGSSSGKYTLPWVYTWTQVGGKGVEGEYLVEVTAVRSGMHRTRRFRQPVQYTDTE